MLRLLNRRRVRTDNADQYSLSKEELFNTLLRGSFSSYDELLEVIRAYPEDVISRCRDAMGNSILHVILCGNFITVDTSGNHDNNYGISSTFLVRKNFSIGTEGNDTAEEATTRTGKSYNLLPLMIFIVHCSNTTDRKNDHTEPDSSNSISVTGSSILRHQSVGGSLPLHIACRFCSVQQLDVVQYLVQEYPCALKCTDVWGNLPLHEACSNSCVALEVVILLLQRYPKAASVPNHDGNLPLHLAVASRFPSTLPGKQCLTGDELQLEVVQCLLCYWPEAVHHANLKGKTVLQLAHDCLSNALIIEFLQSISEPLASPSLSQGNANIVVALEGEYRDQKVPTNPFDDEFYADQARIRPDLKAQEQETFKTTESMDDVDTLHTGDTLFHDERGTDWKTSYGLEPEDVSEHTCVELVEDFRIVFNKNWSEYNPYSHDEYKETESY